MTPQRQVDLMTDRIIREALAEVRREAQVRENGARAIRLCDDAVQAARWCRLRLRVLREEER